MHTVFGQCYLSCCHVVWPNLFFELKLPCWTQVHLWSAAEGDHGAWRQCTVQKSPSPKEQTLSANWLSGLSSWISCKTYHMHYFTYLFQLLDFSFGWVGGFSYLLLFFFHLFKLNYNRISPPFLEFGWFLFTVNTDNWKQAPIIVCVSHYGTFTCPVVMVRLCAV